MNPWLIIVCVVMVFLVLLTVGYLMVQFQSPDDRNQAYLPKAVVVVSMSLACFIVLLLPFDVANRADPLLLQDVGGGLNLALLWNILLWVTVAFVLVVIPFCIFYYEAWEAEDNRIANQIKAGVMYTLGAVIIFVGLFLILWFTVGRTSIPYTSHAAPLADEVANGGPMEACASCSTEDSTLELQVTPVIYAIALLCVLGWVVLILFGGIGLASLPIDLVLAYHHRPRPLSLTEYAEVKVQLGKESEDLGARGLKLQEEQRKSGAKLGKKLKAQIATFKADVDALEKRMNDAETSYKLGGFSPFISLAKLLLGVAAVIISLFWVLHIILWNMTKITPFLNNFFNGMDSAWGFLGTISYAAFTFYLLWAVFAGVIQVGMRSSWLEIHPMKVGNTLMNSFLFNAVLILISAVTVTQFASWSFRPYAAHTAVDSLFSTYISNLLGFRIVFQYFQYAFLGFALLAFVLLLVCPYRKPADE
eukprot:TRINITY_DN2351_c0_g1_i1.p1 TRINITY_DN2351_c0_g1~~TRINITY_DN2351_c0_g1_i1.p1  ORF type:complete len:476 (+),score=132.44 TRINITY_DN2351_c0_g1_i1:313-1740(+)